MSNLLVNVSVFCRVVSLNWVTAGTEWIDSRHNTQYAVHRSVRLSMNNSIVSLLTHRVLQLPLFATLSYFESSCGFRVRLYIISINYNHPSNKNLRLLSTAVNVILGFYCMLHQNRRPHHILDFSYHLFFSCLAHLFPFGFALELATDEILNAY